MSLRSAEPGCDTELTASLCPVVAPSKKTGFCLRDYYQFDSSLQTSSNNYGGCGLTQGIRAGWEDIYVKSLTDQAIPLNGVPNGLYWLEVEVNPITDTGERTIIESDVNNNITLLQITI